MSYDAGINYISVTHGIHNRNVNKKWNGNGFIEITKLNSHPLGDVTLYYKLYFEQGFLPVDVHLSSDQTEILMFSASSDDYYYVTRFCVDESTKCGRDFAEDYSITKPVTSKVIAMHDSDIIYVVGHPDHFGWYFIMTNKMIGGFNWQNNKSFAFKFSNYKPMKDWHSNTCMGPSVCTVNYAEEGSVGYMAIPEEWSLSCDIKDMSSFAENRSWGKM